MLNYQKRKVRNFKKMKYVVSNFFNKTKNKNKIQQCLSFLLKTIIITYQRQNFWDETHLGSEADPMLP